MLSARSISTSCLRGISRDPSETGSLFAAPGPRATSRQLPTSGETEAGTDPQKKHSIRPLPFLHFRAYQHVHGFWRRHHAVSCGRRLRQILLMSELCFRGVGVGTGFRKGSGARAAPSTSGARTCTRKRSIKAGPHAPPPPPHDPAWPRSCPPSPSPCRRSRPSPAPRATGSRVSAPACEHPTFSAIRKLTSSPLTRTSTNRQPSAPADTPSGRRAPRIYPANAPFLTPLLPPRPPSACGSEAPASPGSAGPSKRERRKNCTAVGIPPRATADTHSVLTGCAPEGVAQGGPQAPTRTKGLGLA